MWGDTIHSDPWKALEFIFHAGLLGWGHTSSLQKPGPWLCLPHRFLSLASSSSCCDVSPPTTRQGMWNSLGAVGTSLRVYHLPIKRNYTSQSPLLTQHCPLVFNSMLWLLYKSHHDSLWWKIRPGEANISMKFVWVTNTTPTEPLEVPPVNSLTLQTRTRRRKQLKNKRSPLSEHHPLSPALQHLTLRSTPSNASHPHVINVRSGL